MSDGERTWDEMWMLPCGDAARPDHPAFWAEVIFDQKDGALEACEHCRLRHRGCRFGLDADAPPPRFVRAGSAEDAEARDAELTNLYAAAVERLHELGETEVPLAPYGTARRWRR